MSATTKHSEVEGFKPCSPVSNTGVLNSKHIAESLDTSMFIIDFKSRKLGKSNTKVEGENMTKLKLNATNKISLTDGTEHDLASLKFDLNQFKIPTSFVTLANEISAKVEKERNTLGELIETGKMTVTFKVYDRALVELAIANQLTEFGAPITIVIENQDALPKFDQFEENEFIPLIFESLSVMPKKIQKKSYANGSMVDTWQFAELKVSATNYKIGK